MQEQEKTSQQLWEEAALLGRGGNVEEAADAIRRAVDRAVYEHFIERDNKAP